ncbi:MAG: Abi family protein [Bacilli bacterium]
MDKKFKTLQEQVDILESKGLLIEDRDECIDILLRENYFFINGYRHLLMKSPQDRNFVVGSTFRELYSIFLFDRYLRNIIFKNLLIVENNMKSIISYQLSKKYGYREKDYLNAKNFTNDPDKSRRVKDLINKMKRQIRVNGQQHTATMHYITNYGYIPLWVLVKLLSFGAISDLFTVLKPEDKVGIADIYDVEVSQLEDFLPILANYRNLCAHEDILYDHRTDKSIDNNIYHEKLGILQMDDEYIYGKNDIFAVVIILKYLLTDAEFRLMMREIDYEIGKLSGVIKSIPLAKILDRIGFPENYMELVNM